MTPQQKIRAYFPDDIGAMLRGLSAARPDLNEAWSIIANQVGFSRPDVELGIGIIVIVAAAQHGVQPTADHASASDSTDIENVAGRGG